MDQFQKQSDFNQSVDQSYEYSQMSGKQNSSSNHKAGNFGAKLSYRNNEWLIRLIQLNPHKMNQIIEWISSLSNYLLTKTWKKMQNISSLHFHAFESKKQRYFIFVEQFNQFFCLLKIIDQNGVIVSFKIYQNSQKQPCLSRILKKISKKVPVCIFDHTNDCSFIKKILEKRNPINVVIFIKEYFYLDLANNQKWISTKVNINQVRYNNYYNIRKKFDNNFENTKRVFAKQLENIPKLRQIYIQTQYQIANSVETHFLLQNILTSSTQQLTRAKVINILNQGLSGARNHQQKWQSTEKKHLPGAGVIKKARCNHCHRKMSDLICLGCTYVYGKQIHICIGECFHNFHDDRKMFMKKQKNQICKNIAFFDKKCKQIGNGIEKLIEEEVDDEYLHFIDYLQSKLVKTMNKLNARRNELDKEEADAN